MELAEHIHHMKNCDNYFKVFLTNILFLIQFCFASQRLALAVWERSPGVPHCWLSSLGNNKWKHHGNWRRKRSIVDLRERLQRLVGFSWSMLLFIWQQELSLEGAGVFLSIWSQGNQQLCVFFFNCNPREKQKDYQILMINRASMLGQSTHPFTHPFILLNYDIPDTVQVLGRQWGLRCKMHFQTRGDVHLVLGE